MLTACSSAAQDGVQHLCAGAGEEGHTTGNRPLHTAFCSPKRIQTIPKVYSELLRLRDGLESKEKEMEVFQNAIDEIEKNYGEYLFSPGFFVDN